MKVDIQFRPGNSAAKIILAPNEEFTAQAGAMIAMSGNMDLTTSTHKKSSGGLLKAAKRMLAGESFLQKQYTA